MIRIMGNSPERIPIKDLNDIIYYHQNKDYTEQEYESSRDLQREIKKGKILVIDQTELPKLNGNRTIISAPVRDLNQNDIKKAVSEAMSQVSQPQIDISEIEKIILKLVQTPSASAPTIDVKQIIIDTVKELKNEFGVKESNYNPLDMLEIRRIISDVVAENTPNKTDVSVNTVLQGIAPLITDTIRQEMARVQIGSAHGVKPTTVSDFMGPEYIPDINIGNFKSNVTAEERKTSGGSVSSSLEALKLLNKSK